MKRVGAYYKFNLLESWKKSLEGCYKRCTQVGRILAMTIPIIWIFKVLLCEADSDYSNVPQPVAVRSCPHNSIDILEREDFLRECRLLVRKTMKNCKITLKTYQ